MSLMTPYSSIKEEQVLVEKVSGKLRAHSTKELLNVRNVSALVRRYIFGLSFLNSCLLDVHVL